MKGTVDFGGHNVMKQGSVALRIGEGNGPEQDTGDGAWLTSVKGQKLWVKFFGPIVVIA